MVTAGIDLASKPERTAVCCIQWQSGAAEVTSVERPAGDEDLLRVIATADKVGIDAPFGWPTEFVRAVAGHGNAGRWPADAPNPAKSPKHLQYRETDRSVQSADGQMGCWPLSVSTDRIAIPAMRAAWLFKRLAEAGQPVARDGSGKLVEVYPAAALRAWGFSAQGYKGRKNVGARGKLLDAVLACVPRLRLIDGQRAQFIDSDDALDALVASFVARAAATGGCEPITTGAEGAAAQEGWIALPRSSTLQSLI
jgi:predicted nuclease with RNAse H fold